MIHLCYFADEEEIFEKTCESEEEINNFYIKIYLYEFLKSFEEYGFEYNIPTFYSIDYLDKKSKKFNTAIFNDIEKAKTFLNNKTGIVTVMHFVGNNFYSNIYTYKFFKE